MATHISPVVLRQEIGRRIRVARNNAGLRLEDAADRLEISKSALNRFENGASGVTVHLVRSMMDVYDQRLDEIMDLVRQARVRGWWKQFGVSDKNFVALETAANKASEYQLSFVIGLLQTEDYARALFQSGREQRSADWLSRNVGMRMARQERLTDQEHPLHLDAVIHEFALRCPVGSPSIMHAQLITLALISELPTVTLQVLPTPRYSYEAGYGGFTIFDFPSPGQPSVAFLSHAVGGERWDKAEFVEPARQRFEFLRSLALDPDNSIAYIEQLADELWSPRRVR